MKITICMVVMAVMEPTPGTPWLMPPLDFMVTVVGMAMVMVMAMEAKCLTLAMELAVIAIWVVAMVLLRQLLMEVGKLMETATVAQVVAEEMGAMV